MASIRQENLCWVEAWVLKVGVCVLSPGKFVQGDGGFGGITSALSNRVFTGMCGGVKVDGVGFDIVWDLIGGRRWCVGGKMPLEGPSAGLCFVLTYFVLRSVPCLSSKP